METVRTAYFPPESPLLPRWIPRSGLFLQLMRCVLDGHFQDVTAHIIFPYLFPNTVYVLRTDSQLPNPIPLQRTGGWGSDQVTVPISKDPTDVYDRAEPFALRDGSLLLVFNLWCGYATGGVASTGYPHLWWVQEPVSGTLVPLSDHLVGGRVLWRVGTGAWRSAALEERGLFLPASYENVQCFYERRPPYPRVYYGGTELQLRHTWCRGDDLLRLFAIPRRGRSLGSSILSIRSKLSGIHLFGIAAELGLCDYLKPAPLYSIGAPPSGATAVYRIYDGEKRMAPPDSYLSEPVGAQEAAHSALLVAKRLWMYTAPPREIQTMTDDVS